jgi:HEAT repeat protein
MTEKVEKISTEEFKKHFENLINCLINIAPSRNRVAQMLFLLPKYEEELKEIYEFFSDENFLEKLKLLGIDTGEKVNIEEKGDKFFKKLDHLIWIVFSMFENKETRDILKKLIGKDVPDLHREWFEQKLEVIFSEPTLGDNAKKFLKAMKELSDFSNWHTDYAKIVEKLGRTSDKVRDYLKEHGIIQYSEHDNKVSLTNESQKYKEILEEKLY